MISRQEYKNWDDDLKSTSLGMVVAGYNPERKSIILNQDMFEMENKTSDKNYFSKIIYDVSIRFIGKKYLAGPEHNDVFRILNAENIREKKRIKNMSDYLDKKKWTGKMYKSEIVVNDLKRFLIYFFIIH